MSNAHLAAADDFAANANARGWGHFDFSYRSLHDLDALLEGAGRPGDDARATVAQATLYLGEVLVRQYGCRRGDEIHRLYPPVECPDNAAPVDVGEVVRRRLTEGVPVATQILEAASGWFTPTLTRPAAGDLPALMRAYAHAFVAPAKASGRMWLDFSPESIYRLDEFIAEGWPARPARETYEQLVPGIGAYLGEVLAAETGAAWVSDPVEGFGVTLGGVTAWPMHKVGKRFALGSRHSLGHFYREVASHWRSGNEQVPVTWPSMQEAAGERRLGRWRR